MLTFNVNLYLRVTLSWVGVSLTRYTTFVLMLGIKKSIAERQKGWRANEKTRTQWWKTGQIQNSIYI